MPDVTLEKEFKVDLLDIPEPALSARSDMPVIETKPDAEVKPELKPAPKAEDKPAEAKADAAVDETKKPEESATPEQPEGDLAANDLADVKPKGVQKKIDELTRNWREAERREEAERQEKLRLLTLVEKGGKIEDKPAIQAEQDPEPQKPSRESFGTTDEFAEALADYADQKASWSAKHAVMDALAEQERNAQQRQIEAGQKAAQEAYAQRVEKAIEEYPDYKEVAESPNVTVSIPMAHAILQSEHGPKLAYHFGKNPEEAKRISLLTPPVQLMEMGLLVARLTAPAAKEAPAPQTKPVVSAAPKPLKPLESKSEPVSKAPEEMSMDEYAAYAKNRDKRAGART